VKNSKFLNLHLVSALAAAELSVLTGLTLVHFVLPILVVSQIELIVLIM